MPAQNGITEATWSSLLLDAAVVYIDYGEPGEMILGATRGGVTFGWEEFNVRSPEIDGLKGRLKGVSRVTKASPQVVVNLIEWNLPALRRVIVGCQVSENAATGLATITRNTRLIPDGDYPVNLAMVGIQSRTGRAVVVKLRNPLAVAGFEIPTSDEDEAVAAITFVGHYDTADIEAEPWSIEFPFADPEALVPAEFAGAGWSVADAESLAGDALTVTVSTLPANNGSTITSVEFRVDGGAARASGIAGTGTFPITGLLPDRPTGVQLRARNAVGVGPWSAFKLATPSEGA